MDTDLHNMDNWNSLSYAENASIQDCQYSRVEYGIVRSIRQKAITRNCDVSVKLWMAVTKVERRSTPHSVLSTAQCCTVLCCTVL